MNGLPYYKRYPRDFLEGTVGLTLEEKGAYAILLDLIYLRGGRLPDDSRWIAGHLGCSVRKWNSIRERLLKTGKITVDKSVDNGVDNFMISNFRADFELETTRKFQQKQRENRRGSKKNNGL